MRAKACNEGVTISDAALIATLAKGARDPRMRDELRTWSAADCRNDQMINIGTELERQLEKELSKRRPDNDHHGDRQLRPSPTNKR